MRCPKCHMENGPRDMVCVACGTLIASECPACGSTNPVDAEECPACGQDFSVRWAARRAELPLVDRDSELAAIETALGRAKQGYGQIVGVLGMPGVGKSRLCRELMGRCRTDGMAVHEVRCPPHGQSVSFLPVRDLLRSLCGVRPDEDAEKARKRIAAAMVLLDSLDESHVAFLQTFLGVPDPDNPAPEMEPTPRRHLLFDLATHLILLRSTAEPLVLLIDDAQWLDPDSDALLAQLVERMNETQLLVLLTFRPGYHASWTGKTYYHQLALQPLATEPSEELIRTLLGSDPSLSDGIEVLLGRTRGYPLYIEEAVRLLATTQLLTGEPGDYQLMRPLDRADIPATLESTIAARIENLTELQRRSLFAAAIIAGDVPASILQRVADLPERDLKTSLEVLQAGSFLSGDGRSPVTGYAFNHSLTQEVGYQTLSPQKRTQLHTVAATAFEEVYAGNLGEYASLIAHHWESANDTFKAEHWRRRAIRGVKQIRVRRQPIKKRRR